MIAVTDDVLCKVARIIGGEDAVKIILMLKELGVTTDDQMLSKTELKLNDVRKILFKLYNYSIVQCDRSRDKDTGWFIFRWRIQPDQVEGFINNQKRRILKILKNRLEYEEKHDFYYCGTPGCSRVTFVDAIELIFRCPVCGNALQHFDNTQFIEVLINRIGVLETEIAQFTS
ncbi:MAG: transcription factor [Candidatus Bathyarchaeota archaeon]